MFNHKPAQLVFAVVIFSSMLAAGCSSTVQVEAVQDAPASIAQTPAGPAIDKPVPQANENPAGNPAPETSGWESKQSKSDNQGAVEVTVTPINLDNPGVTVDFEVSLNTHSIDLSMDLAEMASLETDIGVAVEASVWEAPRGGHHVGGRLSFPSSVGGSALLEGAGEIRLIISGLDAPERIFTWQKR